MTDWPLSSNDIVRPADGHSTEVMAAPGGFTDPERLRHHPTLWWSDRRGPHSVKLTRRVVLGSAPGVDVVVSDPSVSRLHLELDPRDDGVWIRDLDSRNGTYCGGVLVTAARVADGDQIRVAGTTITIRYGGTPDRIDLWPSERFGPLIGHSVAMRELFRRLAQVAPTESTALIQGETGTGKELIARAIHHASPRADGPYVVVDCASLPETLLEAELFGHAKGAFTGAGHARAGAFEAAHGGTIFLDEVGEIPLQLQPKLLRVLESRAVRRLGEVPTRPIDVRVISATHRDLRCMVNRGAFREDLYFRLAVIPLSVPALRERPEDIHVLIDHFLPPAKKSLLTSGLLSELVSRPWLGNVRELRNFVERVLALGTHEALTLQSSQTPTEGEEAYPPVPLGEPFKVLRDRWVGYLEREYVAGLLRVHRGNVSAVAHAAGLDRSYVHRLIRRHDLREV
jgi:transcriptional regulator with GAF, ATPase, and Fis domain